MSEHEMERGEVGQAIAPPPSSNGKRRVLGAEDILSANDILMEFEPCPEWAPEGTPDSEKGEFGVYVKQFSAADKDEWDYRTFVEKNMNPDGTQKKPEERTINFEQWRARLCALCMCDGEGNRLFTDPDDIIRLGNKSTEPVDRIFKRAQRLNGMGAEEVKKIAENLSETQGVEQSSDSPDTLGTP